MSQLPEMPAAGWTEQGYDPSAYGGTQEAPPAEGAAPQQAVPHQYGQQQPGWQQDTEPDWGASQQGYAEQPGFAGQAGQAGYAAQPGYGAGQAEPTMVVQDSSATGLPTEFDHLFRDSTPDSRRAIDRQKPMIGGAAPGYLNGAQSAEAAPMPEAPGAEQMAASQGAPYQQFPQQQPAFPQAAEQYQNGAYQDPQYQGMQFQSGQYGQAPGYP